MAAPRKETGRIIESPFINVKFASTPEAMANGLAYLQIDLIDPECHAITLAQFTAIRDEKKSSSMTPWRPTNSSPAPPPL